MVALEYLLFGLLGLSFGSFGNMLIDRLRTEETFSGRSRCPKCRHVIHWYDLIPVLSYVVLSGRCRFCRKPIALLYPVTELLAAGAFLLALFIYPETPVLALIAGIGLSFLVFAAVFDALHRQVPDLCTGIVGVAALSVAIVSGNIGSALIGALIPFSWFGLQWLLSRGAAVGTGDLLLGTVLGLWLGFPDAVTFLIVSYVFGAVVTLILLALQKITWKQKRVPFAPFLAAGVVVTLMGVGEWYVRFIV